LSTRTEPFLPPTPRPPRRLASRTAARAIALGTLLAGFSVLVGLAGAVPARAADDDVWIEYRQKVMKGIGADMGGIGDILKNGLPIVPSVEHHAAAIAESAVLIAPAFEKKVVDGPTDAKKEIWEQPGEFEAAIEKMRDEAQKLAEVVREGRMNELGPQVKALGGACGNCHDSFRVPKEESYKNK